MEEKRGVRAHATAYTVYPERVYIAFPPEPLIMSFETPRRLIHREPPQWRRDGNR